MPLTKGLRDEENERFKNTLQRLIALAFVPENFEVIDRELQVFKLTLAKINQIELQDLLAVLHQSGLDFENMECLADFLATSNCSAKAIGLYQHIQQASQTYSLAIFSKITAAKKGTP